jgi:hypothetical protein
MSDRWFAWQNSWANGVRVIEPRPTEDYPIVPQPIIANIDFYGNDMTLGIRDRQGDLWGFEIIDPVTGQFSFGDAEGDIVAAYFNPTTQTFQLESAGTVGTRVATGINGTFDGYSEFYRGEGAVVMNVHREGSQGSLAQYGTYPLVYAATSPATMFETGYYNCGGLGWINNENGSAVRAYVLYKSSDNAGASSMGKANGLGDIEILGTPPPMEIGNRVWFDENANGIQDAEETGINGVILHLYDATGTTLLATTTTNATGNWYFNTSNVADGSTAAGVQPGIQTNTTYIVRISNTQFLTQGVGLLNGYFLSIADQGASAQPDYSDTDALIATGGLAQITFTTGNTGESSHNLDIGLNRKDVPLSVTYIDLSGAVKNNYNQLQWRVPPGDSYTSFIIEKSVDGYNFNPIATVGAQILDYSDVSLSFSGAVYYRIKGTTVTGKYYYSSIVKLSKENIATISIYPNPATDYLRIMLPPSLQSGEATLTIIAQNGQVVKQQRKTNLSSNEGIDITTLSSGSYILQVKSGGALLTSRFIKSN